MKTELRLVMKSVSAAAALVLLYTPSAYAYIDPGSGAFILQVIGIFIAGVVFYFRQAMYQTWHQLQRVGRKLRGKPEEPKASSGQD